MAARIPGGSDGDSTISHTGRFRLPPDQRSYGIMICVFHCDAYHCGSCLVPGSQPPLRGGHEIWLERASGLRSAEQVLPRQLAGPIAYADG